MLAGLVAGAVAWIAAAEPGWLRLGALVGPGQPHLFRPTRRWAFLESGVAAARLGWPLWAVVNIVALPLVSSHDPQWTLDGLVYCCRNCLYGAVFGILAQGFGDLAVWCFGPERGHAGSPTDSRSESRIVILGGGFAGVATAENLERAFGPDRTVSLTLVSKTNSTDRLLLGLKRTFVRALRSAAGTRSTCPLSIVRRSCRLIARPSHEAAMGHASCQLTL